MLEAIRTFLEKTGIAQLFSTDGWWKTLIMYVIIGALFYLAIVKKFEPLLLLPIAFGMLLANLPGAELMHMDFFFDDYYVSKGIIEAGQHVPLSTVVHEVMDHGGLVDILYLGVKLGIYPSLIFLGIGAMTDFTPLIANPKSLMLGAAAQLGVFVAFFGALFYFSPAESAAIGIIGGADGPTAILVTKILAPSLLGAIAIAAYSYMALIPMIQPPIILTLSMTEVDLLNRYMDDFKRMGFEFESFGGKEYALRGVPSDLYGFTGKEMVTELLDELAGEAPRIRDDIVGDRIATMACKAAVKGNMRISVKEADALIEELLQAENPYTCPHGRPTIISMSKTELEKRFKRIV